MNNSLIIKWWRCRDSNPGHRDYDSPALPAELHRPENLEAYDTVLPPFCQEKHGQVQGLGLKAAGLPTP